MKILIAYDGSESSWAAVTDLRLAGLAHDTQAVVLSVLDGRVKPGEAQVPPRIVEAFERQRGIADDGVACVRDLFPSWEVSAEVRVGAPAWEIIRRAEGEEGHADGDPMDLVVVGSRGFGELKRILLGSVAHRVVTELRCSVRISRGRTERLTADLSKERAAPRLVIGVDGSPDSQAALEAVASRRWPPETRMLVATFEAGTISGTHGWEPNTIWGGDPLRPDAPATADRPSVRVAIDAAAFLKVRGVGTTITTLVKPADPKHGLINAAEIWENGGADCIFVGATGIRGIERFLVGSVSTAVAMNATCSVEIVKARRTRAAKS